VIFFKENHRKAPGRARDCSGNPFCVFAKRLERKARPGFPALPENPGAPKKIIAPCFFVLLITLAVFVFAACTPGQEKISGEGGGGFAAQLTDSFGRTVRLAEYPKRIVSLAPNMTETLFLLGAGDLLVGRTDYCDYTPQVREIPSVGNLTNPNMEFILSLRPGLVVGSTHFQKETLAELENLRIPVYLGIVREDYEEVFGMIMSLAKLVNKTGEGEKIVGDMRARKARIERVVQNAAVRPRVYYMISYGEAGDFTAGRGTFISALIKSAGGLNAGDDIEGWRYTVEGLFRDEPDIILCGALSGGARRLADTVPYNRLRAVREGRVYEIDSNLLDRIGPRNIEGLEMLAGIFHGDLFP
jgi:iron complex transport system substrate-binding protein